MAREHEVAARPEVRNDRSRAGLARQFTRFAEIEAPELDSPLYAELGHAIAGDEALLAIAARVPPYQPPAVLLLAAVQYLLLRGAQHPLARHYPVLSGAPAPDEPAWPRFREFCLTHRAELERLVATRTTQTNVIRRCAALLPAFASIARREARPLALVEIGPSAGLNLNWDLYRYLYTRGGREVARWGDPAARVAVECELRAGELPLPEAPVAISSRSGIDLAPVDIDDDDAVLWLRALIWPEHLERHATLARAIDVARRVRPPLLRGDAVEAIQPVLRALPREVAAVVFATHALYQIPPERLRMLQDALQRASEVAPLWFVSLEFTGADRSELIRVRFASAEREVVRLATASPHGWWLDWDPRDARDPAMHEHRLLRFYARHGLAQPE